MYYIIEHNIRPDGVVNTSEVGRSTFATALSHYYDRASKVVVSTAFTSSHLLLVDETLKVVKTDHLPGLYEEPKEVAQEEGETEVVEASAE